MMFPYYIVRFKRYFNFENSISKVAFPYYIVRFKQNPGVIKKILGRIVSILHSTI